MAIILPFTHPFWITPTDPPSEAQPPRAEKSGTPCPLLPDRALSPIKTSAVLLLSVPGPGRLDGAGPR